MKTFTNRNPESVGHAVSIARDAIGGGRSVVFAGGGTDLLQLVKERIPNRPGSGAPDVIINLKGIAEMNGVAPRNDGGVAIGGLTTLSAVSANADVSARYNAVAEAAASVATLQMRNVGTIAGNVCQRPWCWYYRNGFDCFKAGGNQCYSVGGENQLHAIFGGGPSFIVHPSDVAPALVAFDAIFRVAGSSGERRLSANEFFVLPRDDARHENVLADDEVLVSIELPATSGSVRSGYRKLMDRATWTHAVGSAAVALEMDGNTCRSARIVLGGVAPIPWRVEAAERMLAGQTITAELAEAVGRAAIEGAQPLAKNRYKVPMTQRLVERTVLAVAS